MTHATSARPSFASAMKRWGCSRRATSRRTLSVRCATTMFAFDHLRQSCEQNKDAGRVVIDRGVAGLGRVQALVDGLLGFARGWPVPSRGGRPLAPVLRDLINSLRGKPTNGASCSR